MIPFNVNGKPSDLAIPDDRPFVWTLSDVLSMTGTKFCSATGLCGTCTIHIDGQPTQSCITPVSSAMDKRVITFEVRRPRQGPTTAYASSLIPCMTCAPT